MLWQGDVHGRAAESERRGADAMTLPVSTWIDDGIGLDVFCQCGRTGYVAAATARTRLDATASLAVVAHHLVCTACGEKGAKALQVRFSMKDYYAWARAEVGAAIP